MYRYSEGVEVLLKRNISAPSLDERESPAMADADGKEGG